MNNKFFNSKKNVIAFSVAVIVCIAIIVTTICLVFIKKPKAEYVSATVGEYEVNYDKNGVDKGLSINKYTGSASGGNVEVPETITIEEKVYTVTTIGAKSFSYETNENLGLITSLKLPKTITKIGDEAFTRTQFLTELVIPGKVESYGKQILKGSGVKRLVIENLTPGYGLLTFDGCELNEFVVETICGNTQDYNHQYSNNIRAAKLTLGQGVSDATMLSEMGNKITSLSVYSGTKMFAFTEDAMINEIEVNCTSTQEQLKQTELTKEKTDVVNDVAKKKIKTFHVGEVVDTIRANAFAGYDNLETIYISGKNSISIGNSFTIDVASFDGLSSSCKVLFTEDLDEYEFFITAKTENTVVLRSLMNRFDKLAYIKSVTLDANITEIKDGAFSGLTGLETFEFNNQSVITNIEKGAFRDNAQIAFSGPQNTDSYIYKIMTSADYKGTIAKTYNNEVL